MNEQIVTDIQKLFNHIQEDKNFAKQFSQQNNINDCVVFLKEHGYNLDEKIIMSLGNLCINEYALSNNGELPDELLEQVVGGNAVGDFFKGFLYGFTHPISSLTKLFTKKGREELVQKVQGYDPSEAGDYLVDKFI